MNLQQKLISAKYISDQSNQEHKWGIKDCCTVFLEYHDAVWGTDKASAVKEKYFSKRSAIEFYKSWKLTWRQWLFMNNYEQVDGYPREGDIAFFHQRLFPTVYIYHNGVFWTMSEDDDFTAFDSTVVVNHENVTVWRHK